MIDEESDSASVLRHLHKEVIEFAYKPPDLMDIVEGLVSQEDISSTSSGDRNFDLVASDLKETLTVISE